MNTGEKLDRVVQRNLMTQEKIDKVVDRLGHKIDKVVLYKIKAKITKNRKDKSNV